jgi:NAD(P)-dependent dehydrogenase (short-subunit alcohol dehydrogenase family)
MKGYLIVAGATGGIGSAIVGAALAAGYRVIAVARDEDGLHALVREHESASGLVAVRGSFESEVQAAVVADEIRGLRVRVDGVVAAMAEPLVSGRLLERTAHAITATFEHNVVSHFIAAKHLLPLLATRTRMTSYLVLGCATADFAWAGYGHISMAAAARKMLVHVMREECKDAPVRIQLVQIDGRVCTPKNLRSACRGWAKADAVAREIVDLLQRDDTSGVVHLRTSQTQSATWGDRS